MGGMSMGLGLGTSEELIYDDQGILQNGNLRQYRLMRLSEAPQYVVDFVETPQLDGPYGARGFGEHGIIGIPAALANALSSASNANLKRFPLTPEYIWRATPGTHGGAEGHPDFRMSSEDWGGDDLL